MSTNAGLRLRSLLVTPVKPADLARQAGVSRQYVSSVLRGRRPPSAKIISAARELGLPIHLIVDQDGEPGADS